MRIDVMIDINTPQVKALREVAGQVIGGLIKDFLTPKSVNETASSDQEPQTAPPFVASDVQAGTRWRHYKGDEYVVEGIGQHTESQEWMVYYRSEKTGHFWIRPLEMWLQTVPYTGPVSVAGTEQVVTVRVPRFTLIKPKTENA